MRKVRFKNKFFVIPMIIPIKGVINVLILNLLIRLQYQGNEVNYFYYNYFHRMTVDLMNFSILLAILIFLASLTSIVFRFAKKINSLELLIRIVLDSLVWLLVVIDIAGKA